MIFVKILLTIGVQINNRRYRANCPKSLPSKFKLKYASIFPSATVVRGQESLHKMSVHEKLGNDWLGNIINVLLNQRSVSPTTFTGVLTSRCNNPDLKNVNIQSVSCLLSVFIFFPFSLFW